MLAQTFKDVLDAIMPAAQAYVDNLASLSTEDPEFIMKVIDLEEYPELTVLNITYFAIINAQITDIDGNPMVFANTMCNGFLRSYMHLSVPLST